MALACLVYCDALFPREAYRRMFEPLDEQTPERAARRIMVAFARAGARTRLRGRAC